MRTNNHSPRAPGATWSYAHIHFRSLRDTYEVMRWWPDHPIRLQKWEPYPEVLITCNMCGTGVTEPMEMWEKNAPFPPAACSPDCAERLEALMILSGLAGTWHRLPSDFWVWSKYDTAPPVSLRRAGP